MENLINDNSFEVYHNSEGAKILGWDRTLMQYPDEKNSFDVFLGFTDENKDGKKILRDKIKATLKAYEKIKVINDTYLLDVDNNNDYVSTVSSPSLADKHCYPIKSIVVAISALFSTLFAALLIIIFKK